MTNDELKQPGGRLKAVWLILPPDDTDWVASSVFETWEQAVAILKGDKACDYRVEHDFTDHVILSANDDENYRVHIVRVPIEYVTKDPT